MKIRETISTRKIAILATGDEISNGDILNSNSQEIARRLHDLGIHIGMHAVTSDNIADIEKAISFLLESHQALIITGGLGPTSDDLTRFALSKSLDRPLVFDEPTWDAIVTRLKHFGYLTPPESNRQQALFPEAANIIPNPNGTAAGCWINHHNQFIFMLPGPPTECLPMMDNIVIPVLKQNHFPQISFHKNWMLFGVSEGQIAEELDAIAKPYDCITGYRISYPYIEFKINSCNEKDFHDLITLAEKIVSPYLISEGVQTASDALKKKIEAHKLNIQICDLATGGLLESIIQTPQTYHFLSFIPEKDFAAQLPAFTLSGLTEYWQQNKDCIETPFSLTFNYKNKKETMTAKAPHRGDRVKRYAVEWACYQINHLLST